MLIFLPNCSSSLILSVFDTFFSTVLTCGLARFDCTPHCTICKKLLRAGGAEGCRDNAVKSPDSLSVFAACPDDLSPFPINHIIDKRVTSLRGGGRSDGSMGDAPDP
mmetsp:Transcript_10707/g.23528  ORF Transcript_10707/g.23528 Transcript_10707/m.23528 type:complete len:107 (+) Transcript_10707:132-452(+)